MASSSAKCRFYFHLLLLCLLLLRHGRTASARGSFNKFTRNDRPPLPPEELPSFSQESDEEFYKYNPHGVAFENDDDTTSGKAAAPPPPTHATAAKTSDLPWDSRNNYYGQSTQYSTITRTSRPPSPAAAGKTPPKLPKNYNTVAYVTSAESTAEDEEKEKLTTEEKKKGIPYYYYQYAQQRTRHTSSKSPPPPPPTIRGNTPKLPRNYNTVAYVTSAELDEEEEEENPNNNDAAGLAGSRSPPPPFRATETQRKDPYNYAYNTKSYHGATVDTEEEEGNNDAAATSKYYYYKNYNQKKQQQPQGMSDTRLEENKKYYKNSFDTTATANTYNTFDDEEDDLP